MAKQTLNIGTSANDGTGTNLRSGGTIINDNFTELYTALGNGSAITLTATPTQLNLLTGLSSLSLNIRDDASSVISIPTGGTLKLKSNDGITTTVSQGDTITIGLDSNVVTETSTDTLTNKTLTSPTLTSPTLTSPKIDLIKDANGNEILSFSTTASATDYLVVKNGIGVGTPLHIYAEGDSANIGVHLQPKGSGIFTISDGTDFNKGIRFRSSSSAASTITLIDAVSTAGRVVTLPDATDTLVGRATSDTLTNKSIAASTNTISGLTNTNLSGSAAISNANLANSSVSIGTSTITLGAAATTSIANLNLSGTSSLSGTGTIDSTGQGNKIRFNFANVGARPDATTYQGALAVVTGTAKAYFADSGGWNEIASENSSINLFSDVDLVTAAPTGKQTLSWVSSSGKFIPATLGALTTHPGDGSTFSFTINNLYNVNNILVFVNGLCQVPTTDYTVSGTSLNFISPPPLDAVIMIRYLG